MTGCSGGPPKKIRYWFRSPAFPWAGKGYCDVLFHVEGEEVHVVFIELCDNPGPSVTNACKWIATQFFHEFLAEKFTQEQVHWYEWYEHCESPFTKTTYTWSMAPDYFCCFHMSPYLQANKPDFRFCDDQRILTLFGLEYSAEYLKWLEQTKRYF